VVDCHHKECCGCDRLAEVVAEAMGADGVKRFDLCPQHYDMVVQEAARKGVLVIGTDPIADDDYTP
jgi:hypothetical protein